MFSELRTQVQTLWENTHAEKDIGIIRLQKKYMKEIGSTHMNRGVIGEPFSSFQQYSWHTFIKIFVFCIAIAHALTHVDQNSLLHKDIATSMNTYGWFLCFGITCFFLSFFMMKKWIYTNNRSETKTKWFRRKNHICRYALNEGSSSNRTESSWADVLWHLVPWRLFMCVYRFGQVKRVYSSQSMNL